MTELATRDLGLDLDRAGVGAVVLLHAHDPVLRRAAEGALSAPITRGWGPSPVLTGPTRDNRQPGDRISRLP